ncbi:MAG: SPOR domain-containing protein [Proteobacteria bacterium]|nr:SPOR domain-containing protein [Pseudomonadota bacterium]
MRRWLLGLLIANLAYFGYTRLASEPTTAPAPADGNPAIPRLALVSELAAPAGPACLSVGAFADRATAEQAGNLLRAAHHYARERSAEVAGATTYWVMQTTKTLQQAARVAMRLRAAGVTDLEVNPPGANQTDATLSLGVFADREHAVARQSELRKLAVSATIVEQQHQLTQWWVDVAMRPGDPSLDLPALQKALPAAAEAKATPCPGTAPAPAGPAPPAATPPTPTPALPRDTLPTKPA